MPAQPNWVTLAKVVNLLFNNQKPKPDGKKRLYMKTLQNLGHKVLSSKSIDPTAQQTLYIRDQIVNQKF